MSEPLTRSKTDTGEGALSLAAQRLDRALARLETSLGEAGAAGPAPPQDGRAETLVIELDAARRRQRELEAAAAGASEALGRAMAQVRQTLDEDARRQGALDFGPEGLEPGAASPEEGQAAASPPREEPAA